jgi:hypothetical protein
LLPVISDEIDTTTRVTFIDWRVRTFGRYVAYGTGADATQLHPFRHAKGAMMSKIAGAIALMFVIVAGGTTTAQADDHFNYKNPWKPTKDVSKIPDSLYRGFHYEAKYEPFRKCVLRRESGSNFKADGSGGSGGFQFIQSTWDNYVKRVDAGYVGVRPHKAPPYLQEEIFWLAANPYPKKKGLAGRHHWSASHAHGAGYTSVKDC